MLLDARLETVVEVVAESANFAGRSYHELSLVEDDGQTLHLYAGQLKELPDPELQIGKRYTVRFRPFVNNRWLELKIESIEPLD